MVFSSTTFLFLFLPVVLAFYYPLPRALKNGWLLAASLAFYASGEGAYALVMLASISLNYGFGLALAGRNRGVMAIAVAINLSILVYFKYAAFVVWILFSKQIGPIHLPIGVSFFTFHAISYLVDVYRGKVQPQRKLVDFALYISLFPQLVAGPIIRYHDIADQLGRRTISVDEVAVGLRRFILGLAKKMIVANTVARAADQIFGLPPGDLTASVAWLGVVLYALQIYFDFSAYSDMAIGLGHLFGFRFLENFDYPYIAKSMTEFWRRWHISLSNWFRDYLYIPLGGNRRGPARTYFNLVTVFFLCGLWHGASWTFIVWGLLHGSFLVLERVGLSKLLERSEIAARVYTLFVILLTWVFFRAPALSDAIGYLRGMAGLSGYTPSAAAWHPAVFLSRDVVCALAIGVIGATPIVPWLRKRLQSEAWSLAGSLSLLLLLFVSATLLAASTYNPFIYFRF